MRGFMFSIEMLGVMTLVIIVIATMLSFSVDQPNDTSLITLQKSNQAMLMLYGAEKESISGLTESNVYCKDLADYDTDTNKIITKRYCEETG